MSRLQEMKEDKPKKKFKKYPSGIFHIDIAEALTEESWLYLFVSIDRNSNFTHAELHEKANRQIAAAFLRKLVEIVPYRIHTPLADNRFQFAHLPITRS